MAKDKEQKQDAKPKQPGGDKGAQKASQKPQQQQQQAKAQPKKEAPKPAAAPKPQEPQIPAPPARLAIYYREKVVPELTQKFGYKSVMQVPRITKVTLNMGVGEATGNKKILENALADMAKIAGQKPVSTLARKSIATFKIRDGWPIGCKVTLRRAKMYEFIDRLVNISLPRVRDFRGISGRAFDGRGNYNMGVKEQIIFPEIDFDQVDAMRGMDIAITTSARTDEEAKALLEAFSFPFRN